MSFTSFGDLVQQGIKAASSINPGEVLAKLAPPEQVTEEASLMGKSVIEWASSINATSSINPGEVLPKLALLMGKPVIEWVKHPGESQDMAYVHWLTHSSTEVLKYIIAPGATFSTVFLGVVNLGFNPVGIGARTAAAAIQSALYAGAVPAGGLFATLQSMAMLGTLNPVAMGVAAGLAGSVAFVAWATAVGS